MKKKFVNRVPHIILLYWVIKIASTTLGETGADMFSMTAVVGTAISDFMIERFNTRLCDGISYSDYTIGYLF